MSAFFNRLKEPSTWAGFAALATMFGVNPAITSFVTQAGGAIVNGAAQGGHTGTVAAVVGVISAAAAVFLPEQKPTPPSN